MYLGIDVGGTKTLLGVFTNEGELRETRKFPTSANYNHFLLELKHSLAHLEHDEWQAAGVGIPTSRFDRDEGIALRFGNLKWTNVPIQRDLERIVKAPVALENDAKLASLSEAIAHKKYDKVLYITISTGIGYGVTVGEHIDSNFGDGGGRAIMLPHMGKLTPWEDFASGRAIVKTYGRRAEDIHDEQTWRAIARRLKLGFLELIAITQPDVIVVGGSVGNFFERLKPFLEEELKSQETPSLKIPPLRKAKNPEQAVVYGCYHLAKQRFGHHAATHR